MGTTVAVSAISERTVAKGRWFSWEPGPSRAVGRLPSGLVWLHAKSEVNLRKVFRQLGCGMWQEDGRKLIRYSRPSERVCHWSETSRQSCARFAAGRCGWDEGLAVPYSIRYLHETLDVMALSFLFILAIVGWHVDNNIAIPPWGRHRSSHRLRYDSSDSGFWYGSSSIRLWHGCRNLGYRHGGRNDRYSGSNSRWYGR